MRQVDERDPAMAAGHSRGFHGIRCTEFPPLSSCEYSAAQSQVKDDGSLEKRAAKRWISALVALFCC